MELLDASPDILLKNLQQRNDEIVQKYFQAVFNDNYVSQICLLSD